MVEDASSCKLEEESGEVRGRRPRGGAPRGADRAARVRRRRRGGGTRLARCKGRFTLGGLIGCPFRISSVVALLLKKRRTLPAESEGAQRSSPGGGVAAKDTNE